jgi:hypothetical protein
MPEEQMIEVTLRRSLGVRGKGESVARHYGPGPVKIPLRDAQLLGIVDENGKPREQWRQQEQQHEQLRAEAAKQRAESGAPSSGARAPAEQGEGDDDEEEDEEDEGADYTSWDKEALKAEVEKRGLTAKRPRGEEGPPRKEDFVRALKKYDRQQAK